jgi:hypothetical protein
MASSKTVFRPFCVSAEHSRYLTAPTSFDMATPWEYWMGAIRLSGDIGRHSNAMDRRVLTGLAISQLWLDPHADRVWCQLIPQRLRVHDELSRGTTRVEGDSVFMFQVWKMNRLAFVLTFS